MASTPIRASHRTESKQFDLYDQVEEELGGGPNLGRRTRMLTFFSG